MATPAQIAANRANARRSTGPRTPEGKARSARNSTVHGFRSQAVLLPGDDPADYNSLLEQLTEHFLPSSRDADLTELRAVREMADAEWRLRRARSWIQAALSRKIEELAPLHPNLPPVDLQALAFDALHAAPSSFPQLLRYEAQLERKYDRACRTWTTYQRQKDRLALDELNAYLNAPPPWPAEPNEPNSPAPQLPNEPNEPNSPAPLTPRNAPCPCGSDQKYKRCCGRNAPPALRSAA